jgi:cytochrome bd ubiquinol oxidase subunit II
MDKVVIAYLWLSILLYLLLGGADFGAGIIELFTSRSNRTRTRKTLYHAIGPVWEANHMWLIIVIVILFVGFPTIYSELSIYLHIPLVIMLLGIIARGTAFIFRHYDAVHDQTQRVYNRVFVSSSFITPLFLGIIAGSAVSGYIDHEAESFASRYIFDWLNIFSVAVGLFTASICGYLAAVYLIGEADDDNDRRRFIRKAKVMNATSFVIGGLVFAVAGLNDIPLVRWVTGSGVGIAAVVLATLSVGIMWYFIVKKHRWLPRLLAGFQVTMILLAISFEHYPDFIILKNGPNLSLTEHQAPDSVINALAWALLLGSLFILPALFYLFFVFKSEDKETRPR